MGRFKRENDRLVVTIDMVRFEHPSIYDKNIAAI